MTKDEVVNNDDEWNARDDDNLFDMAMMNAFIVNDDSNSSTDEESANQEQRPGNPEELPLIPKTTQDCLLDFVIKMYLHTLHSRELVTEVRSNKVLPLKHLSVLTLIYTNMRYSEKLLLELLKNEVAMME